MRKISSILFLCLLLSFFFLSSPGTQETITLTTYYPAPFGVYTQLLTQTLGVGDTDGSGQLDSADAPDPNQAANLGDLWIAGDVGIGTTNPEAVLDVSSTASGFLPPRMTTGDRNNISTPVDGMIVYNSTVNRLEIYSNGAWRAIAGGSLPPPNFDSGLLDFQPTLDSRLAFDGLKYTLNFSDFSHTLGSNSNSFLVDVEYDAPGSIAGNLGITELGGTCGKVDIVWRNLTSSSISLDKIHCPGGRISKVRIRIWDYNN